MKKIYTIVFILNIIFAQSLYADEVSHRKLAEELLLIMNTEEALIQSFDQIKKMQIEQLKTIENSEKLVAFQESIMDMFAEELSWERLKSDYEDIYTDVYTEEELQGLVDFYKSPIGQKFVKKNPELMMKMMQISQKQTMEFLPKIQKMTEEFFRKQDDITKDFYDNGKLKNEWVYKNGEIQSTSKGYYATGELKYEYGFVSGVREGITKEYDKNGNLIREWIYKNGELQGQKKD